MSLNYLINEVGHYEEMFRDPDELVYDSDIL
jgi:hypothetical protein